MGMHHTPMCASVHACACAAICVITHTHAPTLTQLRKPSSLFMLAVLLSGLCYAASSGCLTLLNKHALDGFGFRAPNMLLCFQCALTVVLVKACEMFGLVKQLQPVKRDLVLVW